MKRRPLAFLSCLPMLALTAAAQAQAFGTGGQLTIIPATAFRGQSSTDLFSSTGVALTPTANATTNLVAPVVLPNGAVLTEIRLFVVDNDPFNDLSANLFIAGHGVATPTSCGPDSVWAGAAPGLIGTGILTLTGSPIVISAKTFCVQDEAFAQYFLQVPLPSTNTSLSGAVLIWHRQISQAPLGATFNDVPESDPFFRAIEALAASGITSGCGGGNFCPNDVVTRAQVAKFFANALGLHFPE